jgi:hypothetical protein
LELEPTIRDLQVEKGELQNANALFVVPEARGLKHAVEDMKPSDECKETTEKSISMISDLIPESVPKAEARANQDQFNATNIESMSDLEIQGKADLLTDTGTKLSSGDEKLQLLPQVPADKIFQPEIQLLESTEAPKVVEGAKGVEYLENMKIIDGSQSPGENFGSTTSAESSQSDLQQPMKEPQQQKDLREAQDQHQNLHALSANNSSAALVIDAKDGPFNAASANDASAPLEMEKFKAIPFSESEKCTPEEMQLQQTAIVESFQSVGDNLEPSNVKPEEAPHGEEKGTSGEASFRSMARETSATSLSDLLQASDRDISRVAYEFTAETEPNAQKEEMKNVKTEMAEHEEPKIDDDGDGDGDVPVTVETPSDFEIKAAHKKSHNILSGVGSKVKHSIAKVKKAITGKSSHPKTPSPK